MDRNSLRGDESSRGMEMMEVMPGYVELVSRSYAAMASVFRECKGCGLEMFLRTLLDHAYITWREIFMFFMCMFMWTQMRKGLTAYVFQPFARWCRVRPKDVLKMPESAWKLVFYSMSWSYSTYLLFFTNYSFFQNPPSVFYNWRSGMEVPVDIAVAYLIQGSFYGHSIYATLYMDAWRKDSLVMVVHHFITLALITFSYAFRYHNIGLLVLFLHDINDIQLEFTKVNVYFKIRGGKEHFIHELLSNMSAVSFSISWFWFRLYWFPLKVLWASCVTSIQTVPNIPFYFFFNTLLFLLLLMNIYWFLFIVLFVAKVLTGQMKGVNDVREYDEDELKEREDEDDQISSDGKRAENGLNKKRL